MPKKDTIWSIFHFSWKETSVDGLKFRVSTFFRPKKSLVIFLKKFLDKFLKHFQENFLENFLENFQENFLEKCLEKKALVVLKQFLEKNLGQFLKTFSTKMIPYSSSMRQSYSAQQIHCQGQPSFSLILLLQYFSIFSSIKYLFFY